VDPVNTRSPPAAVPCGHSAASEVHSATSSGCTTAKTPDRQTMDDLDNPTNRPDAATERFIQQLAENQNRLYGYVFSLLGNHTRAADVVQETNLVLWRKVAEFQQDKPFLPWAFAIARFQVLAHLRDHKRDRCLLDNDLVERLSRDLEQQSERLDALRAGLRACLKLLPQEQRRLIELRYFNQRSIKNIAVEIGKTSGAIKVAMLRVRRTLAACIEKRLKAEG